MTDKAAKISIDEVVESAAAGVLRALDARQLAAGGTARLDVNELVRSGFSVDFVIRAGGITPFDVVGASKLSGGSR